MKKLFAISILMGFQVLKAQLFQLSCNPHDNNCDPYKIIEPNPQGKLLNGQRDGIWTESFYGMPYAKGKYRNGRKDSLWIYYKINTTKIDTAKKNKIPSEKEFDKAETHSEITFKNGKLNGNQYVWLHKDKLVVECRYKNDSLVDTLHWYGIQGEPTVHSFNYNKVHYDSAYAKMNGMNYLEARLPHAEIRYYEGKDKYFKFVGYTDGTRFLMWDKKKKSVQILLYRTNFLYDMRRDEGKAEGSYSYIVKNEVISSYDIDEGRKEKTKDPFAHE